MTTMLTLPIVTRNGIDMPRDWAVKRERELREQHYRRAFPDEAAAADFADASLTAADSFARMGNAMKKAREQWQLSPTG